MPVRLGSFSEGLLRGLEYGDRSRERRELSEIRKRGLEMQEKQAGMNEQLFRQRVEQNRLQLEELMHSSKQREQLDTASQRYKTQLGEIEQRFKKKIIPSLYKGAAAAATGDFDIPSVEDFNEVFENEINQGGPEGAKKSFLRFEPAPDGKMTAILKVEPKDGKPYEAPVTINRSNDPNDPVMSFNSQVLMTEVEAKRHALINYALDRAEAGDDSWLKEVMKHERELEKLKRQREDEATKQGRMDERERFRQSSMDQRTEPPAQLITGADGQLYRVPKAMGGEAEVVAGPAGGVTLGKPTASGQKYIELVQLGVPQEVARGVAYGAIKEIRDNRNRPSLVDVTTGQVIGALDRDPETDELVWVPNRQALPASSRTGGATRAGTGRDYDPSPPRVEQRTIGKIYQTPRGPLKWMGNGWLPLQ